MCGTKESDVAVPGGERNDTRQRERERYECVYMYVYVCVYVCVCEYIYIYIYIYIFRVVQLMADALHSRRPCTANARSRAGARLRDALRHDHVAALAAWACSFGSFFWRMK